MPTFATDPGATVTPMTTTEMIEGLLCGNITLGNLNWLFKQLFDMSHQFTDCAGVPLPESVAVATCANLTAALAALPGEKFLQGLGGYNAATNVLTLNMNDGSTVDVDMTALIADAAASGISSVPTLSAGAPAGAPTLGQPIFAVDTTTSPYTPYVWNGAAWTPFGTPIAITSEIEAGVIFDKVVVPQALKSAFQNEANNYPIFIGQGAGKDSRFNGVSIGKGAGYQPRNTAIGEGALVVNSTGNFNTAVGFNVANSVTTGGSNTFYGDSCGNSIVTGSYNTAIGWLAFNAPGNDFTNSTAIGCLAQPAGSNVVLLGDPATTPNAYAALVIVSDERDKTDVKALEDKMHHFLDLIEVFSYRMDPRDAYIEVQTVANPQYVKAPKKGVADKRTDLQKRKTIEIIVDVERDGSRAGERTHFGLIAQQVKKASDAFGIDFAGFKDATVKGGKDRLHLDYTAFIPLLIQRAQYLTKQMASLEGRIASLEAGK